ncbi:hypothetical protein BC332_12291 [Capsicum chinense]|nr:hypothetical protein BC332_12291 [Capsicum chinense]
MGKATRWFKGLLGMNKDKQNVGMLNSSEKRDKKRWSFRRKSSKESTGENLVNFSGSVSEVYTNWLKSYISEKETEQRKHAIAAGAAAATAAAAAGDAAATAAAAAGDAAVAAAQVAAAMVRLTSQGRGGMFKWAATKIQSVFRGYLARKAVRALKGLVKFQALVRGFLVRKRAAATLNSMQALSAVRSQRARRSMTNDTRHQPEMRARRSHSVCLQTVSAVVTEKAPLVNSDAQPSSSRGDAHHQRNNQKPDKLQSDLAAAVRGNDILKCEVQNALDTLSCALYKLEDLELQVLKMDEHINQLTNDLPSCGRKLRATVR